MKPRSNGPGRAEAAGTDGTQAMASSYDRYFASGLYRSRYPRPNRRTLAVLEGLLPAGGRMLDYGAGEGRYSLALAASRSAQVEALDISAAARAALSERVRAAGLADKVTVRASLADLARCEFDVVLLAFGVLAHVAGRDRRLALLRELRTMLAPQGRLVLGLPNARRRFRAEQARAASEPQPPGFEDGDIRYQRRSDAGAVELFYHLFDRKGIYRDLGEAGYEIERLTAESVLPETAVTNSRTLAFADDLMAGIVPPDWSYGYLVVSRPSA